METNSDESGLSTQEALKRLYNEIEQVLRTQKTQKTRRGTFWLKSALCHTNQNTTINWISSSFQLWSAISLMLAFMLDSSQTCAILLESLVTLIFLILNILLEFYDSKLCHNEIPNRIQAVLERIKLEIDSNQIKWTEKHYPNLCSPTSPCITLQWTYRDNKLVNLPWSLLVKDDVILMRPGQLCPGFCEALDKNSEFPLLHAKEVFAPNLQNPNEIFSAPKCRKSLEYKKYKLLETPYLNNLRIYLEQALDRPVTQLNQQRHLITVRLIERGLLPFVFIAIFLVNIVRYFYRIRHEQQTAAHLFLVNPINAILPLLPLVFPIAWKFLNYLGLAYFKSIVDLSREQVVMQENSLEEDDNENLTVIEHAELKLNYLTLYENLLRIINGKPDMLVHSANILHVLGSVTALGCVDKKGILSWPNPTAEKVFFLRNSDNDDNVSPASSLGNIGDLMPDAESIGGGTQHLFDSPNTAQVEVLDLTHNHNDPFKLHFDDKEWRKHLNNLKPLGLAILLNTCNDQTQECYTSFCSHITCEAIYNENLVPVTNRRCLCELAKEIGFSENAQKIFALEHQLSTFRHLQPEMVRRDNKYARSLQLSTKLKFPFPHMFAVVVKELGSGSNQLLSEGTADIILDSCVDYWDGNDLCPLTNSDRKRIQDFYQRSSLTANCTAFAYRPLNKSVNNKLNGVYLELPSDSRHLYTNYQSPTPLHWDCKSVLQPKMKNAALGQFYSTDSLLYNDGPTVDISDAESCFQMQCNQVFIGMVTMQYQAITDMVQLIEQLERACIRFVHFSKENELRSRVFSEKMGLESGWNCHISLLSERNSNLESLKTMSFSAPSAINMEHSVVKFEIEPQIDKNSSDQNGDYSKLSQVDTSVGQQNEINTSHDWQSLSCLTDSTEQSVPINFDMSNRAKLPRGIDKIRPHIELIDNVPLLVSLFTDCTPSATREMLNIMQDYGEVVCILGSASNCENAGIFMQADAGIAVEPLYPQTCQKSPAYSNPTDCISPIHLARELNSIACALCFKREDPISLYHLIMISRHFVTVLWSALQFWLSCCVTLSLMQLICNFLMLPMLFSTGQVLWLNCVVLPILSVSLMCTKLDRGDVMRKPQGKNQVGINANLAIFILWCYGLKFVPTIITLIGFYMGMLRGWCLNRVCNVSNCTCDYFYLPSNDENSRLLDENGLELIQIVNLLVLLLHFVFISVGFVFRDHLIYKRLPFRNVFWLITSVLLIVIQSLYTFLSYLSISNDKNHFTLPKWVIIFGLVSPFCVLLINELIKQQEIKVNERFRKRVRLDFGTKLGMNSPF